MKRGLILIALAAFLGPACASDVTDAVHAWMGKWPNEPFNRQPVPDSKRGHASKDHRTFWQFPGTRAGLEAAIGKKRAAVLINVWTEGDNLKMAGPRWATYMSCMPHNCGGNQAQVFIDTVSGRFNVCWTEWTKDSSSNVWLWPGGESAPLNNECLQYNGQDYADLIAHIAR